ncbi:MAG: hypothetical protein RR228_00745 [Bacilli bacterium]
MQEIIPFKKNIILKTNAYQITDISLKHNYKIEKGIITGSFKLGGSYKITMGSVLQEDFLYDIPFSIALGDRIDKSTVELLIDDFSYVLNKDTLSLDIKMQLNYEEVLRDNIEELINDFSEEKENTSIKDNTTIKNNNINNIDNINVLTNNLKDSNNFVTYKIYISKDNDTYDTIASKYNIDAAVLKEYNTSETVNVNDRIIVPFITNE